MMFCHLQVNLLEVEHNSISTPTPIKEPYLSHSAWKIQSLKDFGLNHFEKVGMHLFTMVSTNRYAAKALALAPLQTEPEHWHPPIDDDPGKQETVRVAYGTLYFYLPGDGDITHGYIPEGKESVFTCRKEFVMKPGDQLTLEPGTKHWFQAGEEGAVMYSFSTCVRDALDGFTDPEVVRETIVVG